SLAVECHDLELPTARRNQEMSISIPVSPLEVIQLVDLTIRFQPVVDPQAVYRLIHAEFASSPAEALHTEEAVAAGLAFLHAGVAMLIPRVRRVSWGRVQCFFPAAPPFVGKLNRRN